MLKLFRVLVVAIVILSSIDGFATIYEINMGLATEANPVMREVMKFGDAVFLSVKLIITACGCMYLNVIAIQRPKLRTKILILMVFIIIIYGWVLMRHVDILSGII